MDNSNDGHDMISSPIPLGKLMFMLALVKAGVAGAGVGLAALGVADMAFAVSAAQYWDAVKPEPLINTFAAVGGTLAVVWRIVSAFRG